MKQGPGAIVATVDPPANVELRSATGEWLATASTNSCHVATFEDLAPGVYSLAVEHGGVVHVLKRVAVEPDRDTAVDLIVQEQVKRHPELKSNCLPPRVLSGPPIQYTDQAIRDHVQGCVLAKCIITTSGGVRDCEMLETLGPMTEPVLNALLQRRYAPMTCDGKAVETSYTFQVSLRVRG